MEKITVPSTGKRSVQGVVFAAALLALAGCSDSTPPTPRAATPVSVITIEPSAISIPASLSGEIRARVQQDVAFRTGGRISQLLAEVGDHVTKGQLLAGLDPQEQQSNARLAAAAVTSAEAQVTQAQANFDRQKSLLGQGFTTRANFDEAQTALATAQGSLAAAKADEASAAELVSYTELHADADGIVVARNVETDQVIQAAQPIYAIAEDGPRDTVFELSEASLTDIPHDIAVDIELIANPAVRARGHVREIAPTVDTSTGTVRVKVSLDSVTPDMPLGAAVTGNIHLPPVTAFALPWSALFGDASGPAVWVVDTATNTVSIKPVTVSRFIPDSVIVTAGLEAGERVVSRGLQLLRPGQLVSAIEEAVK